MRLFLFFPILLASVLFAQTPGTGSVDASAVPAVQESFEKGGFDEFEEEFDSGEEEDEFDPLSGYNRAMTSFNDGFYENVLFPVARGYRYVVPEGGRKAVGRFFDNLQFPIRFVNNVLQLKMANSGEELSRFVINTTVGLLGLFDPAEEWFGLEEHKEDFGQTLGYYGVGGGFHIVWPILGPSNLRDSVGLVGDWYLDPAVYWEEREYNLVKNKYEGYGITVADTINDSSFQIEEYQSLKKDALDLYPFFKDIYRQNREKMIKE